MVNGVLCHQLADSKEPVFAVCQQTAKTIAPLSSSSRRQSNQIGYPVPPGYTGSCHVAALPSASRWQRLHALPSASTWQRALPSASRRQTCHVSATCATWGSRLSIWMLCRPPADGKEKAHHADRSHGSMTWQSGLCRRLCRRHTFSIDIIKQNLK